jgi:hypothetical protein
MINEALRMIRKATIQKPNIKEFNFSFQIEHYTASTRIYDYEVLRLQ